MLDLSPAEINARYPIAQVDIYKNGGMVVKRISLTPAPLNVDRKRSKIEKLSLRSRTRLAFLVSECSANLRSLLTLTYLDSPIDLRQSKMHLHRFLTRMLKYYGKFSYIWFMEFTRRGMAHFHLLLSLQAQNVSRETIARFWVDSVGVGDWWYSNLRTKREYSVRSAMLAVARHPNSLQAIRKPDGAKRYALKYALKPYQKQVPDWIRLTGRFWGNSADLVPATLVQDVDITEAELREMLGPEHRLARQELLPKYIYR